ncbi:Gp15 family bacteriophage protein [Companilactobacillus sp. DQM5]|uniref:Gp15 family bacteriophage protein n=1 Tax=Companilactobacillus sp. DQM5 TaxID=3463359 RepID=UPI0040594AB2
MFRLNDPLEDFIKINNKKYSVDMSFDNVLDALDYLNDKEMTVIDRIDTFIDLMIIDFTANSELEKKSAVEQVIKLINIEPVESQKYDIEGNPMPTKKGNENEQLISFSFDSKYIYAAFMQAYGIDLIDQQGKLHWVKFSAMLNALPEDTMMRKIIDIRGTDLKDIKDKKEKARMRELKKTYRLPNQEIEEGGEDYG